MGFEDTWEALSAIGRDPATGEYARPAFGAAEVEVRRWFRHQAGRRGFRVLADAHGNLFATWRVPMLQFTTEQAPTAILTGSHLDSGAEGGADSGVLGVASAFAAIDLLRERGFAPGRPVIVAAFAAGSGSRFPIESLGSRLAVAALDPDQLAAVTDRDGITWAEAVEAAEATGADSVDLLDQVATFVEVTVEGGAALRAREFPVGLVSRCWARARYRVEIGPDPLAEEVGDPMLTAGFLILAAAKQARLTGHRAVVASVLAEPGVGRSQRVVMSLELAAASDEALVGLASAIVRQAEDRATRDATSVAFHGEWADPAVEFDAGLAQWLAVEHLEGDWPTLESPAHAEAAVFARAGVSTALLAVRAEGPGRVSEADRRQAVYALADTLARLAR